MVVNGSRQVNTATAMKRAKFLTPLIENRARQHERPSSEGNPPAG